MEDEKEIAKIIEVLEGLSQKYNIVNVRLDQHDKLFEKYESLFAKFEKLEEYVLNEAEKEHAARLDIMRDVHKFEKILDEFKKINNHLGEKVVGFEKPLKEHFEAFENHQQQVSDSFNDLYEALKEIRCVAAPYSELKAFKDQQDLINKGILKDFEKQRDLLEKYKEQFQSLSDQLRNLEDANLVLKDALKKESSKGEKEYCEVKGLLQSTKNVLETKYKSLLHEFKQELEKAKKEMVLSPESYQSLQDEMNKRTELMALDAQNSVLKASVCDQQLKVVQRHIDAINQKIKLFELEK